MLFAPCLGVGIGCGDYTVAPDRPELTISDEDVLCPYCQHQPLEDSEIEPLSGEVAARLDWNDSLCQMLYSDMDWMLRNGEVYKYDDWTGVVGYHHHKGDGDGGLGIDWDLWAPFLVQDLEEAVATAIHEMREHYGEVHPVGENFPDECTYCRS